MPLVFRRFAALALLALLAAFVPFARPALAATTIHVTNTADSGAGSLRAAMTSAVNGDTIVFDNSGATWTIKPLSPLPLLDKGNVTIDGGSGHKIVLDGSQVLDPQFASTADGIRIASSGNTIKGLVIVKFPRAAGIPLGYGGAGIHIRGTDLSGNDRPVVTGNKILGSWLGVAADGV